MQNVQDIIKKILKLIEEIESYESCKRSFKDSVNLLFKDYQSGKYDYMKYKKLLKSALKGKSKKDWVEYYNSYIYSLLKQIEPLLSQVIYIVGEDKAYELISLGKPIKDNVPSTKTKHIRHQIPEPKHPSIEASELPQPIPDPFTQGRSSKELSLIGRTFRATGLALKEIKRAISSKDEEEIPSAIIEEKKKGFLSRTISKIIPFKKVRMGYVKDLYKKVVEPEREFVSDKTKVSPSLQLKSLKKKFKPLLEEGSVKPTVLREEVKSIKQILEKKRAFKIYEPSFIGAFASALLKKLTFYLIDTFPGFFKKLYDSLRMANIKMLSNTYVNIMLLAMICSSIASTVFFGMFFSLVRNPLFLVIAKTIIMDILVVGVTFLMFYSYPHMKIKSREADINANLPFAINHIAAVAGSGVPPTKMFKLIAESIEYGEISIEVEKIVEYVDLFGYDLLTALRSVAIITPAQAFKEFLEGVISTIESGGDITEYLKDKASEAMLAYELERQKYTETISTYSDIYTGILIAAPLFFMVALSLVSMLGGSIGGIEVNVLIIVGTYVVIPFLNIAFLIFLSLTQPQI